MVNMLIRFLLYIGKGLVGESELIVNMLIRFWLDMNCKYSGAMCVMV